MKYIAFTTLPHRLVAAVVNSLFSFWWDVTNDWGLDLLKPRSREDSRNGSSFQRRLTSSLRTTTPLLGRHCASSHQEVFETGIARDSDHQYQVYPYGLRPILLFPLPVYPLVISLDLILRMTWSIKLSSHLHSKTDGSIVIFWIEVAEVARRWMWVFIRIEWEVIRRSQDAAHKKEINDYDESESDYEMILSAENSSL